MLTHSIHKLLIMKNKQLKISPVLVDKIIRELSTIEPNDL